MSLQTLTMAGTEEQMRERDVARELIIISLPEKVTYTKKDLFIYFIN